MRRVINPYDRLDSPQARKIEMPQKSNRARLLEGTLRCLQRLPAEQVTARAIAKESGANLASIAYHFGNKDNLVTEAAIAGLDRWLADVARRLEGVDARSPRARFVRAFEAVEQSRRDQLGLVQNYLAAVAKAQHSARIRKLLAGGFRRTRPQVAALLALGTDAAAHDAAGLLLAMFHGMLLQVMLDPALAVEARHVQRATKRLRRVL
jgi:AcrR family transcriptional regulator